MYNVFNIYLYEVEDKFLYPEVHIQGEGAAVPLHGRLSLGRVIIDYVSIQ